MASSSLIRDALASAQQELAKKRSHSAHSSSSSSHHAAIKRPKTSHPPSRPASSSTQSIKDAVAASRSELDANRTHSLSHPPALASPPPKPLSPYERFISDHWEDDEYDGLGDDERRTALNRRFEAVSFSKKEAWTSEWQQLMEVWEADMARWEAQQQQQQGKADSRGTADNGASSSSSSGRHGASSHRPASTARPTKHAASASSVSSPTSSSASPPPSQSSMANDFSSSPLIAQHYTQHGGQLSLVPYINKHSKAFLTLTFPLTKVSALISLLPLPADPPIQRLFPLLTVATLSRAIDYFIQHMSALVLASAVAGGSKVLRPEDYRAVILRRAELWWLRWAQEDDRDVRGRYRTGQLAALEKKRRDAEDRARGRKIKEDDGSGSGQHREDGEEEEEDEREGDELDDSHYASDGDDSRRVDDERADGSRMEEDDDEDSRVEASAAQQNRHSTTAADEDTGKDVHGASTHNRVNDDNQGDDD